MLVNLISVLPTHRQMRNPSVFPFVFVGIYLFLLIFGLKNVRWLKDLKNVPLNNQLLAKQKELTLKQLLSKENGMVNYLSSVVFFILLIIGSGIVALLYNESNPFLSYAVGICWLISDLFISASIQMIAQWEKAVVFRLGKFSSTKGPGVFLIIPLVDQTRVIDMRILATDIPTQQVITKDNVPVKINGVLFFKVDHAADAIIQVQDYRYAISQYAQTSLRDVVGQMTLDQLLVEREQIGKAIEATVEKDTKGWGLEVTGIRMQDIDMPEDLKKMMSRQASAEREKRATITKAEGDREAAVNLAAAARTMSDSPGAMQLRTLQTIDGLGPTASNTVVLAVPINILEVADQIAQNLKAKKPV